MVKRMLCKHLSPVRLWYSPLAELVQLVERNLAKVDVIGSNPIFRSIWPLNSAVRVSACLAESQGFKSPRGRRPYTFSVLYVGSIDKLNAL